MKKKYYVCPVQHSSCERRTVRCTWRFTPTSSSIPLATLRNGLCVEPNPWYHAILAAKRSCRLVACAVGDKEGGAKFFFNGPSSGFLDGNVDNRFLRGRANTRGTVGSVRTVRFATILEQLQAPTTIDFLSLDARLRRQTRAKPCLR